MTTEHVGPSRRRLLASGAGVAGGAAALSLLPPSVHRALAMPARPGGLKAVKHVVLLMQENRSFDHYFGTLRGVRGFGDRNAIAQPNGQSVFSQPQSGSGNVLPFPLRDAAGLAHKDLQWMASLPHGWPDGQGAHADGWNNGWIGAKGAATMAYTDRKDIPFQYELADTFTVCDAYHCSVFSSTSPNRNYFVSGYTGFEADGSRAVTNAAYSEDTHPGYTWASYAEVLEKAGVSWKVYQERDNYQDNNVEFFVTFKQVARKALQGDFKSMDSFYSALASASADRQKQMLARLAEGVAKLSAAERSLYERGLNRVESGGLAKAFRKDVETGNLPKVSYIVPSAADSEHPSASSPIQGARITYDILDAIASDPEVWASTVVFVTFDENDGLFDHVPPPVPPDSISDEHVGGSPIGLGFRVPMTVVSPWSVGGFVNSQVFDHSSLVRFVERWLGVRAPDISAWRRTVSGDLVSAFDFSGLRPVRRPTQPGAVPAFTGRWHPAPPANQKMPVPEPGVRPARPLPYQPDAHATLKNGSLRVTLRNEGRESVHFALYPYAKELPKPAHFDVARRTYQDIPLHGAYDLVLTGPNGFRREFVGSGRESAEVTSVVGPETFEVVLANHGRTPLSYRIEALAYGSGSRTITIPPNTVRPVHWPTRHGWYDVRVTVAEDPTFVRRLAGHLENGRPSVSG